jgi:hypothetical protein
MKIEKFRYIVVGVLILSACSYKPPVTTELTPSAIAVATPTEASVIQETPLPTTETSTETTPPLQVPVSEIQPGLYLIDDKCNLLTIEGGHDNLSVNMCITSVAIDASKNMRFNVFWTARAESGEYRTIYKGSDVENRNMYLVDNLGNRYDHIDTGGSASLDDQFYINEETHEGWYLFPPAMPGASSFTFHDDDQQVSFDNIVFTNLANYYVTSLKLQANDLAFDTTRNLLYVAVSENDSQYANSVLAIDPSSAIIVKTMITGISPQKLAISGNDEYLYISFGEETIIRRIDLASGETDTTIELLPDNRTCHSTPIRFYADDIVILKEQPRTIVVLIKSTCGVSAIAVYDDATQRPNLIDLNDILIDAIEPSNSDSLIYGLSAAKADSLLHEMVVSTQGISVTSSSASCIICERAFDMDFKFNEGFLYATNGDVIDPQSQATIGIYEAAGSVQPMANGLIYFLDYRTSAWPTTVLKIFDLATFAPTAEIIIPGVLGAPGQAANMGLNDETRNFGLVNLLTSLGDGSFAFRTDAGEVFLINGINPVP